MQKDFKIGLAIGVIFAVGVVLWLATLPNLSAQARALQAASNINSSPQAPPITSSPATSPIPPDSELRNTNYEIRDTNNEIRNTNDEIRTRIHIVQKGDTLSSISAKYYGSAKQWRKIVLANGDNLPNPNRLIPGSKLIIPQ
jgi:5'-nucleotidase/UDP-sugar diphosphatase